ncbi:MAG TPA: DinB family protein [Bryobacteraceae bacterium]|jgi:hypothetical protein|nr:DinB family protein [Bryobacteraceae bacterium]
MDPHQSLRAELDRLLAGRGAHAGFDAAVARFPEDLYSVKPDGAPHSAWDLLEHMRLAQRDMLDFCRNPKHVSPEWPEGYWPKEPAEPAKADWDGSVKAFREDLGEMRRMVADPQSDLFTPFPHGEGQSLLREALQLADHNAYHVGELVFLRRLLGSWPA